MTMIGGGNMTWGHEEPWQCRDLSSFLIHNTALWSSFCHIQSHMDTHSISRLPYFSLSSLICLIPGFQARQICRKHNLKFSSSTSTSAINFTTVFHLIAHLCSRFSNVCSNRSCSLLLRPCFPDYCRDNKHNGTNFDGELTLMT